MNSQVIDSQILLRVVHEVACCRKLAFVDKVEICRQKLVVVVEVICYCRGDMMSSTGVLSSISCCCERNGFYQRREICRQAVDDVVIEVICYCRVDTCSSILRISQMQYILLPTGNCFSNTFSILYSRYKFYHGVVEVVGSEGLMDEIQTVI